MVVCTDWWDTCLSTTLCKENKEEICIAFLTDMSPLFQFSFIIELPIIFTKEKLI